MIRRPPRSTHCISSAASDVYKRQVQADINNLYYDIRMLCYKSINDKPMIVNIVMTKYENCIVFILDTNTVRHFFEITMRQRETLTKSAKNK